MGKAFISDLVGDDMTKQVLQLRFGSIQRGDIQ